MLPVVKYLQIFTISLMILGAIIDRPGWSDEQPVDSPILSESLCQTVFGRIRVGNEQIFDKDRQIVQIDTVKSGRWDSNPRRSPWEGDILPLNYTRDRSTS
jgi:hypothetical protein